LQDWHGNEHGLSQQTPSVQFFDSHWAPLVQGSPCWSSCTQTPASQAACPPQPVRLPLTQDPDWHTMLFTIEGLAHVLPHGVPFTAAQVPWPLQLA
jgi:hypothetical protein